MIAHGPRMEADGTVSSSGAGTGRSASSPLAYLAAMLINIVIPTGLDSPRGALFNFDWIRSSSWSCCCSSAAIYYVIARPDRRSPKLQDLDSPATGRHPREGHEGVGQER